MKDYIKKLKNTLKEASTILVGVGNVEGEEICNFLKKENKDFIAIKKPETVFWQDVSAEVREKVSNAIKSKETVLSVCIIGDLPKGVISVSSYWHDGDKIFSPLEQLSLAFTGDISPYHRLISANSQGFILEMRDITAELLGGFWGKTRYKKILKDANVTEEDIQNYKQKFYDSGEVGMEKIPESFRAGIGLVIKKIRKRDRALQGITEEQEVQAERAIIDSYLIGSITVVDIEDLKPAAVIDRLIEAEQYGILMLSSESVFMGPWSKVKKFEKHFSGSKVDGGPKHGTWKGSYSKPLIIEFVKNIEKVKDKKEVKDKNKVFMKI